MEPCASADADGLRCAAFEALTSEALAAGSQSIAAGYAKFAQVANSLVEQLPSIQVAWSVHECVAEAAETVATVAARMHMDWLRSAQSSALAQYLAGLLDLPGESFRAYGHHGLLCEEQVACLESALKALSILLKEANTLHSEWVRDTAKRLEACASDPSLVALVSRVLRALSCSAGGREALLSLPHKERLFERCIKLGGSAGMSASRSTQALLYLHVTAYSSLDTHATPCAAPDAESRADAQVGMHGNTSAGTVGDVQSEPSRMHASCGWALDGVSNFFGDMPLHTFSSTYWEKRLCHFKPCPQRSRLCRELCSSVTRALLSPCHLPQLPPPSIAETRSEFESNMTVRGACSAHAAPARSRSYARRRAAQASALLCQLEAEASDLGTAARLGEDMNICRNTGSCVSDPASARAEIFGTPGQPIMPSTVASSLGRGFSIALKSVQWRSAAVCSVATALATALGAPVNANAYVTPVGASGLAAHYDDHCVFVLQLAGEKTWQLSLPQPAEVLPELHSARDRRPPGTNAVTEIVLREGEMLYLPRGMVHCCRAGDTAVPLDGLHNIGSVHLTFGVECDACLSVHATLQLAIVSLADALCTTQNGTHVDENDDPRVGSGSVDLVLQRVESAAAATQAAAAHIHHADDVDADADGDDAASGAVAVRVACAIATEAMSGSGSAGCSLADGLRAQNAYDGGVLKDKDDVDDQAPRPDVMAPRLSIGPRSCCRCALCSELADQLLRSPFASSPSQLGAAACTSKTRKRSRGDGASVGCACSRRECMGRGASAAEISVDPYVDETEDGFRSCASRAAPSAPTAPSDTWRWIDLVHASLLCAKSRHADMRAIATVRLGRNADVDPNMADTNHGDSYPSPFSTPSNGDGDYGAFAGMTSANAGIDPAETSTSEQSTHVQRLQRLLQSVRPNFEEAVGILDSGAMEQLSWILHGREKHGFSALSVDESRFRRRSGRWRSSVVGPSAENVSAVSSGCECFCELSRIIARSSNELSEPSAPFKRELQTELETLWEKLVRALSHHRAAIASACAEQEFHLHEALAARELASETFLRVSEANKKTGLTVWAVLR